MLLVWGAWIGAAAAQGEVPQFGPGTVDVSGGFAFQGFAYGVQSILTAFGGWNEVTAQTDIGVFRTKGITIGVGAEVNHRRPWLLELVTEGLFNGLGQGEHSFDLNVYESGLLGQASLHVSPDLLEVGTMDLYGSLLVGPSIYHQGVRYDGPEGSGRYRSDTVGLRAGLSTGVNLVTPQRLLFNADLRYLVGLGYRSSETLVVQDADGNTIARLTMNNQQRAPRGFGWTVGLGYRFF